MTYWLQYCSALAIFVLVCETTGYHATLTEEECRQKMDNNPVLLQWVEFAKRNAGKQCVYQMLPA